MSSADSVAAITLRFYFFSLLAFLLSGACIYLLGSALKRYGFLSSVGILRRPNIQAQDAIGSECPYRQRFGYCTRCVPYSGLRRYLTLNKWSNPVSLHQSIEVRFVTWLCFALVTIRITDFSAPFERR